MKKWINYVWLMVLLLGLLGGAYLYALQTDQENFDSLGVESNMMEEPTNRAVGFDVPADELGDKNFVKSGKLTKEGQFTYLPRGQRIELRQLAKNTTVIKNGHVKYQLKTVKLLVNSSKTIEAQQHARNKFNDQNLGRQFMTVQVTYTLENDYPYDIYTDGAVAVSYMNGSAVTALSGLQNDSRLQSVIPANSKIETGMTVLVPASQRDQLQPMNFEFASIYDETGKLVTPKTAPYKISF